MKAVGYVRVSTEEQAAQGVSLDAQRAKIEAYCQLYDLELVAVYVDAGASGKSLDREGLQVALGRLREGEAEALVVAKLDRLTRKVADLSVLIEEYFGQGRRFQLLSVSEQVDTRTAAGRLVLNLLATVAQWERETIGERTSTAMKWKRANGQYTGGGVPYGYYLHDGELIPHPVEQSVIRAARHFRERGKSLRGISAALEEAGLKPRLGGVFSPAQVKLMLK
jgi:site-specific DNA recombinase